MARVRRSMAENKVWEFDWNAVKGRELQDLVKALGSETEDAAAFPYMVRVIKRWPFEADPGKVESYPELGLADYAEVFRRFGESFRGVFRASGQEVKAEGSN